MCFIKYSIETSPQPSVGQPAWQLPLRNFQKHVYLFGTITSYSHFPPSRKYQLTAALNINEIPLFFKSEVLIFSENAFFTKQSVRMTLFKSNDLIFFNNRSKSLR